MNSIPEPSLGRAGGAIGIASLSRPLMKRLLVALGIALAAVVGLLLVTLAIPLEIWRTGEQPRPPLALEPAVAPDFPNRVWVDTDAACGEGGRTDPDDCFALLALSADTTLEIVGISTVFGNAAIERTTAVTEELVRTIAWRGQSAPPVYSGSSRRLDPGTDAPPRAAHRALRDALAAGPLTVLALGPLTNIAATLDGHPELRANLALLVAVMGRRTGHLFHPAEGAGGGMLFGHGPVFRDFNVAQDPEAVTRVLGLKIPMTFVPYDVAREVEVTGDHLSSMEAAAGAAAWVARHSWDWLAYWKEQVGREGFYPFDLLAAAYVMDPGIFRCARVRVWAGVDETMFDPIWKPSALLVTQDTSEIVKPLAIGSARYCPQAKGVLKGRLVRMLSPATPGLRAGDGDL